MDDFFAGAAVGLIMLLLVMTFLEWFNPGINTPPCHYYFGTERKSISHEKARDIPHKGRKPNTITIICEESNK